MITTATDSPAAWRGNQLDADKRWTFEFDDRARRDLLAALKKARDPEKGLFDYRRQDFDLGAGWPVIAAALDETKRGRGVALIRGLPRNDLDEREFKLLTWAIGLHAGVARPQGKASQYISAVRDAGTAYRTGTGRGYSSNAELDFHTDSADIVFLSCYNKAASGGMSITHSARRDHRSAARRPVQGVRKASSERSRHDVARMKRDAARFQCQRHVWSSRMMPPMPC